MRLRMATNNLPQKRRMDEDRRKSPDRRDTPGHTPHVPEQLGELLEVQGFDLMAQVEALLRHAVQYQREVQRLRGLLGKGQTTTSEMSPRAAIEHHIAQIQDAHLSFGTTLAAIEGALQELASER
jgi:hypothetical protein